MALSSSPRLPAGHGRISVSQHAGKAVFTERSATYPLKLLSPRVPADGVAVVYVLGYGGGLVGGDEVMLSVEILDGAKLVMLTQGSTKVFKTRAVGSRRAGAKPTVFRNRTLTVQTMTYNVGQGSNLFLLPEPAQLFRDASYNQIQKFNLDASASLVLIDSITAGRQSQDEEWDFSRYYSMNQVRVQGKLIANDVVLLQDQTEEQIRAHLPTRTLRDQLAPYSCYAMVILCGPLVQTTIQDMTKRYDSLVVFQQRIPEDCIWSFSPLDTFSPTNQGAIVRVAGKEAEMVRSQLKDILRQLEHIIGVDVFRRAFT